jgi:hypothetical protein
MKRGSVPAMTSRASFRAVIHEADFRTLELNG